MEKYCFLILEELEVIVKAITPLEGTMNGFLPVIVLLLRCAKFMSRYSIKLYE